MSLIFKNSQARLTSALKNNLLNSEINIIKRNVNLSAKITPVKYNLPSTYLNNEKKSCFNLDSNLVVKRFNSTSKEKGMIKYFYSNYNCFIIIICIYFFLIFLNFI